MVAVIIEFEVMPKKIITTPIPLPIGVTGALSPYPAVEIVTITDHTESRKVENC